MFLRIVIPAFFLFVTVALCQEEKHETRLLEIRLNAPSPAWSIRIEKVYHCDNGLWVVASLKLRRGVLAPQVISTLVDSVEISAAPELSVKYAVIGKTWQWSDNDEYFYPADDDELQKLLPSGRLIYSGRSK